MTVCTCAGKRLHTLPSHQTTGEHQGGTLTNKQITKPLSVRECTNSHDNDDNDDDDDDDDDDDKTLFESAICLR